MVALQRCFRPLTGIVILNDTVSLFICLILWTRFRPLTGIVIFYVKMINEAYGDLQKAFPSPCGGCDF